MIGDEQEFLFSLFNKTASPELREAIIEGVYQMGRQPMVTFTTAGSCTRWTVTGGESLGRKSKSGSV